MNKFLKRLLPSFLNERLSELSVLDRGQLDILSGLNDGYWEWNTKTNRISWSKKLFELLELGPNVEVDFNLFMDLVHPEDREYVDRELERYLKAQDIYVIEYRMKVGGEYQWFQDRGFLIHDKNLMIGTMTNIDEKKRTQLRLQKVIEASNDIFWEWNFSDHIGWIGGYNPHIQLTKFHLKSLFKKPNRMIQIYRKDRLRVLNKWRQLEKSEFDTEKMVFRILTNDYFRWVKCSVKVEKDSNGKIVSASGSLTDIQDHKEIERSLEKRTRDLKESNDMLENFAFAASHDLQAPIRHIRHFTEFLRDAIDKEDPVKINEYFSLINNSTLKMKSLVQGLLEYSRLGRVKLNVERIPVVDFLEDIFSLYQITLGEKDSFRIEMNTKLRFIVVDKLLFRQVVQNLIDNSLKFKDPNRLFSFIVKVSLERSEVVLEFIDNGKGIDELAKKNVFNLFFKGGAAEGNGIGLSICQLIVNQHSGYIRIDSQKEIGTTVTVGLPL